MCIRDRHNALGNFDKLRYIQIARHRVSQTVTFPHKNVRIVNIHNAPNCVVTVKLQGIIGRILVAVSYTHLAINMALEGIMLTASLLAVMFSAWLQNCWAGLLGAVLGGLLMSLFFAWLHLYKDSDLIITGLALNTLSLIHICTG